MMTSPSVLNFSQPRPAVPCVLIEPHTSSESDSLGNHVDEDLEEVMRAGHVPERHALRHPVVARGTVEKTTQQEKDHVKRGSFSISENVMIDQHVPNFPTGFATYHFSSDRKLQPQHLHCVRCVLIRCQHRVRSMQPRIEIQTKNTTAKIEGSEFERLDPQ